MNTEIVPENTVNPDTIPSTVRWTSIASYIAFAFGISWTIWLGLGALGMIFAWLRFRSGSVWPSTMSHAAFNAQAGFGALLLSPADSLLRAPIGIIGLIPMFLFALWLAIRGHLKAQPDQVATPVSAPAPVQA